jgi:hypothetical protein
LLSPELTLNNPLRMAFPQLETSSLTVPPTGTPAKLRLFWHAACASEDPNRPTVNVKATIAAARRIAPAHDRGAALLAPDRVARKNFKMAPATDECDSYAGQRRKMHQIQ